MGERLWRKAQLRHGRDEREWLQCRWRGGRRGGVAGAGVESVAQVALADLVAIRLRRIVHVRCPHRSRAEHAQRKQQQQQRMTANAAHFLFMLARTGG